jgi:hypothetical protein
MMTRKSFLCQSAAGLAGCCAVLTVPSVAAATIQEPAPRDSEKEFIKAWLSDLMAAIQREPDPAIRSRLVSACGRACFERHEFKRNWAVAGRGDVGKLIEALKANFEVWRDGDEVHIRYGAVSKGCYCPAAKYRPAAPDDVHCHCSQGSHQAVWQTALGRPVRVDIVESVRRGGRTCRFVVRLAA